MRPSRDGGAASGPPTIVIAAGGTAGHVVPALAIADALRAEGARVVFAGGERAEAELVPAAGYELEPLRVEGISRSNPLKAAARRRARGRRGRRRARTARAPRRRRGARRRRLRRRAGRPRRAARADPRRPHRGRLAPRADQPPARAARPPRLPRVPDRRAATGERYLVTGRPVPPTVDDREGARAAFGIPPDATCVLIFGGSLGRALDQPRRRRGVRRRALPRAARPGARDFAALRAARPALRAARVRRPVRQRAAAADLARRARRRLGVRARPVRPAGGARSPIRTPPPTTRPPTRAGWRRRAPPRSCATTS